MLSQSANVLDRWSTSEDPRTVPSQHDQLFTELVAAGLAAEEDRRIWHLLTDERGRRLLSVLEGRTRYVTLVLEAVHDGHNQAAVLRTADAFGVQDVVVVEADARFSPNHSISQGAHSWLSLRRFTAVREAINDLHRRGYQVWASHLDPSAVDLEDIPLDQPIALLFGNEHQGVSDTAIEDADGTFVIPMRGFVQSLNVSVAAAISTYHVTRTASREAPERYSLDMPEKREVLALWMRRHLPRGRPLPPTSRGSNS
jgi:tRNA (guanosine-2'-O-)-methyltransferase